MTSYISYGGGVNSTAMAIMMVEDGWRGPIVFADTGGEHPETYSYMEYFEREYLNPRSLGIIRLIPGDEYHTEASEPLEAYCLRKRTIPLLTIRWCSIRWKRKPLNAFQKGHGITVAAIGISTDEPKRVRPDAPDRIYPLVERGISRAECRRIIQRAGLEIPPRSSCFFCPGQTIGEWRELYYKHPDLYERACKMEETSYHRKKGTNVLFRFDRVPLRVLARRWQGQLRMEL